jgi:hypothetical protein
MFKLLTAINPAAGVATEVLKGLGGILLRYWWLIVLGVAVWHYAGLRVEVATTRSTIISLEQSLETSRAAVGRAQGMRAAIINLEATNAELAAQVDQLTVNAAEWQAAAEAAANRPPVVEVVYRDRIDATSPQAMAASGATVAREIAAQIRARLEAEGGAP